MSIDHESRRSEDIQGEILRLLFHYRGGEGLSVAEIASDLDRSKTGVRNNLRVMATDFSTGAWVEKIPGTRNVHQQRPTHWRLTERGRMVASRRGAR